jgi:hypothetical protein
MWGSELLSQFRGLPRWTHRRIRRRIRIGAGSRYVALLPGGAEGLECWAHVKGGTLARVFDPHLTADIYSKRLAPFLPGLLRAVSGSSTLLGHDVSARLWRTGVV